MTRNLWIDSETWSRTPLTHGSDRYAEQAEVMLFSCALEDEAPHVVDFTNAEAIPYHIQEALCDPDVLVWGQNSGMFDWRVFEQAWPNLCKTVPQERRRDTMVQAYSHSLPGSLGDMCTVLGISEDEAKLDGKKLIQLFCKPQSEAFAKKFGTDRATRLTHPEEWERFKLYAGRDITSMRAAHKKMPMWNYRGKQVELWHIDQRINQRGICVDLELARAVVDMAASEQKRLAKQTQDITEDGVASAMQRDALLGFILARYGVDLPDMKADTLERRIEDPELPSGVRELLRVRLQASTASVSKFKKVLKAVNSDGRIRGTMQWRGAARTGRVGHRLVQPGNMYRPDMKAEEIEWAIDLLKRDALQLVYGNVMRVLANMTRGMIVAPPGRKLVVSDLSNIEGRKAAWIAGEQWKLDAFRAFDGGEGHDLYILAYAKSFNVPPETVPEKGSERQIGKVEELMFQYGGGVGAWLTGAATYGIDLDKMTEQVWPVLPAIERDEAQSYLTYLYGVQEQASLDRVAKTKAKHAKGEMTDGELATRMQAEVERLEDAKKKARFNLPDRTFIACDAIKRLWRKAHPAISSYWKELENAVRYCVSMPGEQITCRRVKMRYDPGWLRIGLPSGRVLCYPNAQVAEDGSISYMGINQYSRQWGRIQTYGGKLFENIVQAAAADQIFECMPAIEAEGYEIVLSVHDEFVTETPDTGDFTHERLSELMCQDHGWNAGLPLAAVGYEARRYRKE